MNGGSDSTWINSGNSPHWIKMTLNDMFVKIKNVVENTKVKNTRSERNEIHLKGYFTQVSAKIN